MNYNITEYKRCGKTYINLRTGVIYMEGTEGLGLGSEVSMGSFSLSFKIFALRVYILFMLLKIIPKISFWILPLSHSLDKERVVTIKMKNV